jgi:uncharacterized cofD-like protein
LKGRGPRIVAIGGGTGLSSLLRGLKTYTSNLSVIVTVADDGGSSGRLRDEYRILRPGDFRQCLIALADAEPLMKQLFDHRFKEGSLNGHSFGNLFIMAMADVTGNFEHALRESGKVLAVKGTIVPSTLQDVTLVASINGSNVEGESKIPSRTVDQPGLPCRTEPGHPEAAGDLNAEWSPRPGSLYTSILPNLSWWAWSRRIKASPALAKPGPQLQSPEMGGGICCAGRRLHHPGASIQETRGRQPADCKVRTWESPYTRTGASPRASLPKVADLRPEG